MKIFCRNIFFAILLLVTAFSDVVAEESRPPFNTPSVTDGDAGTQVVEQLFRLYSYYDYFNRKYPDEAIREADLKPEIQQLMPNLEGQKLYDKEENIRQTVLAWRGLQNLYFKIKEKLLTPEPPPLMIEDEDFDQPYTDAYIESEDLVVKLDFKKVIPYSYEKRDLEAIEARMARDREKELADNNFIKLKQKLSQLEFKKLPFYGVVFADPFTGKSGIGKWVEAEGFGAGMMTEMTAVSADKSVRGVLRVTVPEGYLIPLEKDAFQLSFSSSTNLESFQMFYPIPLRIIKGEGDITGYASGAPFLLEFNVKDSTLPLNLKADLSLKACKDDQCQNIVLHPELELEAGEAETTGVSNYISNLFKLLPVKEHDDLKLVSAVVDDPLQEGEGRILRLNFKAGIPPERFEAFVVGPDEIHFKRPYQTLDGRNIVMRFQAQNPEQELSGKKYTITAKLNPVTSIRQDIIPEKASLFDARSGDLSFGLFFLAFFGGFLLNFMPCVFPALSIKLLSVLQFGAAEEKRVRRGFLWTVAGIFTAFAFLIALLSALKALGYAIGWGMQFQNTSFLVIMLFILVLFMAQILGVIQIRTPQFVGKILYRPCDKDSFLQFLTGLLVVVLSTPCTAPYLGTALGFALAGTYVDMSVIMLAVALGLSMPYLLVALWPDIVGYLPKPGPWQQKLYNFMLLMLLLTVIWLLSVLSAQTGWNIMLRLSLYLGLFMIILWFRHLLLERLEREYETEIVKRRASFLFNFFAVLISLGLLYSSLTKAAQEYKIARQETAAIADTRLDYSAIQERLKNNKIVLVRIGADWCLTCKFNNVTVFNNDTIRDLLKYNDIEVIDIDWTNYNPQVLEFMAKFGRKGLPFYVVFSPRMPDGMVLPEILTEKEMSEIIENLRY